MAIAVEKTSIIPFTSPNGGGMLSEDFFFDYENVTNQKSW